MPLNKESSESTQELAVAATKIVVYAVAIAVAVLLLAGTAAAVRLLLGF